MAKPVLGRGLEQLLEAHGAIRPADGNTLEERPPAPLGVGVRVLITPPPAVSRPVAGSIRSVEPPVTSTPSTLTTSPTSRVSRAIQVRSSKLAAALIAADLLLCVVAGVLFCHPATRGNGLIAGLGGAAVALAAWLACEAFLLRRAAD